MSAINAARLIVGQHIFWLGFKLMPKNVRNAISTIVNVGQQWAKVDHEKFEEIVDALKADRPHKVIVTIYGTEIQYADIKTQD